jgi:CheY-like chemotaxis protein
MTPPTPRCRVLIVEDETITAMMLEDLVQDLGCEVVGPAGRLSDALKLAAGEKLDAALLDVNLGGEAVYPVADALAPRNVPMVFLTGYGAQVIPPAHAHCPVLGKPFRPQDLARLLAQALQLPAA